MAVLGNIRRFFALPQRGESRILLIETDGILALVLVKGFVL